MIHTCTDNFEKVAHALGESFESHTSPRHVLNNALQMVGIPYKFRTTGQSTGAIEVTLNLRIDPDLPAYNRTAIAHTANEAKDALANEVLAEHCELLLQRISGIEQRRQNDIRLSGEAFLQEVQAMWPDVFDPDNPKPLKIGVGADLMKALGCSRRLVSAFLSRWTKRTEYHRAMLSHSHRYNLDGTEAGAIATEHKNVSAQRLAYRSRKAERSEEQISAKALYNAWSLHWPDVFNKEWPKPLNVAEVRLQLAQETGLPMDIIDTTLWWWMRRYEYQQACSADSKRYELPGLDQNQN
jgi:hypothetical protein